MGYFKRLSGAMVGLAALIAAGSALAQQTTITLLTAERDETMQPVIKGFEKLHPDIKVVHQSVPFNDLNAAIESRIGQGDTSIDVIAADTPRIPAFASKGYLKDLSDRSDKIKAGSPNPVDLEQVSYDGKIYAYPMWTSTQMLYFNRALLKRAGVEFPSGEVNKRLTWDQVIDAAKATQKAGAKWGIEFQQFDRYYQLQALFESAGAGSGLTGDGLLKSDVGSEAWVATAKWYGDLFTDEVAPRGVNPEQTDDLFFNGEVAFLVGGPWSISRFEASKDLDYGVAPHPFFKGGKPVTATGSWALAINPKTTHIEAAQAFAEYASLTGEGNYLTTENNPVPPTNPDAFKTYADKMASLAGKIGPVVDLINSELQNTAVGRPRTVGFVAFETVMNKAFADIRNGSDAGETLKSAEKQIDRQLSRLK